MIHFRSWGQSGRNVALHVTLTHDPMQTLSVTDRRRLALIQKPDILEVIYRSLLQ
jgi:hypothetical protein